MGQEPHCKTCADTGMVTVCIDEHGMQDIMPCGDCPDPIPRVSQLVARRWIEKERAQTKEKE